MSGSFAQRSYYAEKAAERALLDRLDQECRDSRAAEVETRQASLEMIARAMSDPFMAMGFGNQNFGPGIGNQPPHDVLMRENMGPAARSTRAIKNRVATLNPQVKDKKTGELLPDNPLQALLDKPHPDISRSMLLGLSADWVVTTGEAYWQKVFGTVLKTTPLQLQPIPPTQIHPIIEGGVVTGYRAGNGVSPTRIFEANEIIRFYFPDPENIFGSEGYLGPAGITADSIKYSGQHLREHYRTDATPPTVLESSAEAAPPPTPGSEMANRLDAIWTQKYHRIQGSAKGVPIQLPTGLKLIQMAMQTGADIVPLLEFWSKEQGMDFGVPKSLLGLVESGDRSSVEVNQWVFDLYSVTPVATLFDEGITLQLAPDFDDRLVVEFEPFVSKDKEFLLKKRKQDLDTKQISIDQAREEDGKDPQPWGKDPVGTFAEVPYQPSVEDDPAPPGAPGGDEPAEPTSADSPGIGIAEDIQKSLLNGAQVAAMVQIVVSVQSGELPRPSGVAILQAAFGISASEASDIMAGAGRSRTLVGRLFWRTAEPEPREPTPLMRSAYARIVNADATYKAPMAKELRKIFRKQQADVLKKLKKLRSRIKAGDIFDPDEWFDEYKKTVEPIRGSAFVDVATDTITELVPDGQYVHKQSVQKALERQGAKMVQHVGKTTKDAIARELKAASAAGEGTGAITKRIKSVFEDATKSRARTIAQHEIGKASSMAQLEGFDQSGVVSAKQWNHSFIPEDARENHISIDGQQRSTDDPFDLGGGVQADAPRVGVGGGELEASESIGCACFVTPVVEG